MPLKSAKQYRYFQSIANNSSDSPIGPSKKVANEFIEKTPYKLRSKWAKKKKSN